MKVLILEDEDILRKVLVRTLRNAGFQVIDAACIRDADTILSKERIDLIVSDIGLPDGNGLDFFREVHERFPEIFGIVMTAQNSRENQLAAKKMGIETFFTKPVCLKDLKDVIFRLDCRRVDLGDETLGNAPLDTLQKLC
ncbi:MAG: response regulator [Nitrospiria bacterium]